MHGRDGARARDARRRPNNLPLRQILWLPEKIGGLGLMPAALLPDKVVGLKAITFFPGNEGTELDTHQGAVLLFEAERGRLLAILDATSITAIRTAAVSGVATRLLAKEDAGDLAIIGSGVQARTHLEAMTIARRIRRVRVAGKDRQRAEAFAARSRRGMASASRSRKTSARPFSAPTSSARRPPRAIPFFSETGSPPARTSTRSVRASRTPASSTRRPS
jgi:ornithine cyclodeaminase/alanine dehydrogenase-like protein (mu-crystallin family)